MIVFQVANSKLLSYSMQQQIHQLKQSITEVLQSQFQLKLELKLEEPSQPLLLIAVLREVVIFNLEKIPFSEATLTRNKL